MIIANHRRLLRRNDIHTVIKNPTQISSKPYTKRGSSYHRYDCKKKSNRNLCAKISQIIIYIHSIKTFEFPKRESSILSYNHSNFTFYCIYPYSYRYPHLSYTCIVSNDKVYQYRRALSVYLLFLVAFNCTRIREACIHN